MVRDLPELILDPPAELKFKGPFRDVTTACLKLTNPTERLMCFKLKTTAPKTYCVRPNAGFIKPNQTCLVSVMLQPIDLETAEKSKHKFMVQSTFVPVDGDITDEFLTTYDIDDLWHETPPKDFANYKLKCVFISSDADSQVTLGSVGNRRTELGSAPEISNLVPENFSPKASPGKDVSKENKQLKTAIAALKQENSRLKEESLRYRVTRSGTSETTSTQMKSAVNPSSHACLKQKSLFSACTITVSIVIFCIGIFLGSNYF